MAGSPSGAWTGSSTTPCSNAVDEVARGESPIRSDAALVDTLERSTNPRSGMGLSRALLSEASEMIDRPSGAVRKCEQA